MAIKKEEIKDTVKELFSAAEKLNGQVKKRTPPTISIKELKEFLVPIQEKITELTDKYIERESTNVSQFMQDVGHSFVSAQKNLDKASQEYLLSNVGNGHTFPTVFRIPKITADIKFAFEKSEKEGFNVVFYKDTTEATSRHQQSISFEMLAVPPSVEVLGNLPSTTFRLNFVLSPTSRDEIFTKIQNATKGPNVGDDPALISNAKHKNKVVIIDDADNLGYFLFLPDSDLGDGKKFRIWHFNPKEGQTGFFKRVLNKLISTQQLEPLKQFALDLSIKQEKLIETMLVEAG